MGGDEEAGEEEGEEAEEEGQEEEEEKEKEEEEAGGGAEEEGHWALRHQDAVRRPRRDLRQEQDVPPGGREGHLGLHQEEQAQQGPHHHAGREAEEGLARQLGEHVQGRRCTASTSSKCAVECTKHRTAMLSLAKSHDVPALSRSCHFRSVDVRLPHRHAVGFGGAL